MPAPLVKAGDWKSLQRVLDALYDREDTELITNRDLVNDAVDARVLAPGAITVADIPGDVRVKIVLNSYIAGPSPTSPVGFTTAGGRVFLFASGSGYVPSGVGQAGQQVWLDGVYIGNIEHYFNVNNSHATHVPRIFDLGWLAPGSHSVNFYPAGATSDGGDRFHFFAVEVGV